MYNYNHNEIRLFMAEEANGTIVEQALIAAKNLESAIYKRKDINMVEQTALQMFLQCADEIREHLENKPVVDRPTTLPREMREGLKPDIVNAMVSKSPSRFTRNDYGQITDTEGRVWAFNLSNRLYRVL